ncbi:hypothetical protein [Streptomyces sp. NPDC047973]|uniref:hypothetical protein n=1 Tax=Streptomyces sp. NPDC047973 TaxID=3155383 RepID=UPI00343BE8DA
MSPAAEQWEEVLTTRFALGEGRSAVRAAAVFSADAGFFATAGREGEGGHQHFRPAPGAGSGPAPDASYLAALEALWTRGGETASPPALRLADADWYRESLERITDAVTGTELDLVLLRDGERSMWAVRTRRGICVFALVDGAAPDHSDEARSLTLDFDSFLVGQGY